MKFTLRKSRGIGSTNWIVRCRYLDSSGPWQMYVYDNYDDALTSLQIMVSAVEGGQDHRGYVLWAKGLVSVGNSMDPGTLKPKASAYDPFWDLNQYDVGPYDDFDPYNDNDYPRYCEGCNDHH